MSSLPPEPPEPSRVPEPARPPGLGQPAVRIGNPEREAVVERLSAALSDGRLDLVEYDDRVRQVYAAKTHADLVPITADLPAPPPPAPPKPRLLDRIGPAERAWMSGAVILTAIWLMGFIGSDGEAHGFWPMWVLGIWGASIVARRITGR